MNIYKVIILVGLFGISGVMATGSEDESGSGEYEFSRMEEGRLSKKVSFEDDKAEKMLSKLEEGEECSDCEPSTEKKTDIKELLYNEMLELAGPDLSDSAKKRARKKLNSWLKEEMPKRSWFGKDEDARRRYRVEKKLLQVLIEATNESTIVAKKALKEQKKQLKEQKNQRKLAEQARDTAREALQKQGETLTIYKRTTFIGGAATALSVALNVIQAYFNFTSDEA